MHWRSERSYRGRTISSAALTYCYLLVVGACTQFEDEEVERRYLHFLSTHSLSLDARLFYLAGLVLTIQIQVSRGQQCEELATDPCPVAFWALRVVTALWVLLVALLLTFLLASKSTRSAMMPRYQELLLTCAVVSFVL